MPSKILLSIFSIVLVTGSDVSYSMKLPHKTQIDYERLPYIKTSNSRVILLDPVLVEQSIIIKNLVEKATGELIQVSLTSEQLENIVKLLKMKPKDINEAMHELDAKSLTGLMEAVNYLDIKNIKLPHKTQYERLPYIKTSNSRFILLDPILVEQSITIKNLVEKATGEFIQVSLTSSQLDNIVKLLKMSPKDLTEEMQKLDIKGWTDLKEVVNYLDIKKKK